VGPEGRVYAFEPGPPFFNRLKENAGLNPSVQSRLELVPQGLSDQVGHLHWHEDPQFPGNAFLFGRGGQSVPVTTLDSFFEGKLERLDFIKVDVEGMEEEVLRGGRGLLTRFQPAILFESTLEFESHRARPTRKALAEFLLSLGYDLYRIDTHGGFQPVHYPDFGNNTLALCRNFSQ
jgi:FkbM family methyltransferase